MAKKLAKKELDAYRELLLERRAMLTGDSAVEMSNGSGGDEADQGSEAVEIDFMFSIMQSQSNILQEIDEALERIDDSSYGICVETDKAIPKAHLKAIPWTKYTVEAQRAMESQGNNF